MAKSPTKKPKPPNKNPYKANQYKPDPRQAAFLAFYLDPKSETFSNALQSALKAKYDMNYAKSLVSRMPTWLAEKVGELDMLRKAERNINNVLEMETKQPVITMIGPVTDEKGNPVLKENPNLLKIKADVSKFAAERLGRARWGRTEIPGGDGDDSNPELHIHFHNDRIVKVVRSAESEIEKELDKGIQLQNNG